MSSFVGLRPVVSLRLSNPLLRSRYPAEGTLVGGLDTGYDGFLAVPGFIFDALSLDELQTTSRMVTLADGRRAASRVANGTIDLLGPGVSLDGPIETIPGLTEVLAGTWFLSRFRVTLDYCIRTASLRSCRK